MILWRVEFEDGSSVWLQNEDADGAKLQAQFMAWRASGKWWPVAAVEREG